MVKPLTSVAGQIVTAPVGLKAKCSFCLRSFVTEGGEELEAERAQRFNGKFSQATGLISLIMTCPSCGRGQLEFRTKVRDNQPWPY